MALVGKPVKFYWMRGKRIYFNRRRPYCLGPFQDYILWRSAEGMGPEIIRFKFGVSARSVATWRAWARKHAGLSTSMSAMLMLITRRVGFATGLKARLDRDVTGLVLFV